MLPLLQFLSKYPSLYILNKGGTVSWWEWVWDRGHWYICRREGREDTTYKKLIFVVYKYFDILIVWLVCICPRIFEQILYLTGAPALVSIFLRSAQIKIFLVWFKSIEVRFVQTRPFPISCIARAETVRKTNKLVVLVDYDICKLTSMLDQHTTCCFMYIKKIKESDPC